MSLVVLSFRSNPDFLILKAKLLSLKRTLAVTRMDKNGEDFSKSTTELAGAIAAAADVSTVDASTHDTPSTSLRLSKSTQSPDSYRNSFVFGPDDQDPKQQGGWSWDELITSAECPPRRPEDVSYRGTNLPLACTSGDLPLVAMLLAEGSDLGLNMYAADAVRSEYR